MEPLKDAGHDKILNTQEQPDTSLEMSSKVNVDKKSPDNLSSSVKSQKSLNSLAKREKDDQPLNDAPSQCKQSASPETHTKLSTRIKIYNGFKRLFKKNKTRPKKSDNSAVNDEFEATSSSTGKIGRRNTINSKSSGKGIDMISRSFTMATHLCRDQKDNFVASNSDLPQLANKDGLQNLQNTDKPSESSNDAKNVLSKESDLDTKSSGDQNQDIQGANNNSGLEDKDNVGVNGVNENILQSDSLKEPTSQEQDSSTERPEPSDTSGVKLDSELTDRNSIKAEEPKTGISETQSTTIENAQDSRNSKQSFLSETSDACGSTSLRSNLDSASQSVNEAGVIDSECKASESDALQPPPATASIPPPPPPPTTASIPPPPPPPAKASIPPPPPPPDKASIPPPPPPPDKASIPPPPPPPDKASIPPPPPPPAKASIPPPPPPPATASIPPPPPATASTTSPPPPPPKASSIPSVSATPPPSPPATSTAASIPSLSQASSPLNADKPGSKSMNNLNTETGRKLVTSSIAKCPLLPMSKFVGSGSLMTFVK